MAASGGHGRATGNAMLWDTAELLAVAGGTLDPWGWPPSMQHVMDMQDIVWRLAIRITQVSITAGSETNEKPFQEKLHAVASRIFACFSTSMLDWEIEREHTQSNAQTKANFHIDITSTASMLVPPGEGQQHTGFRRLEYQRRVIELKRKETDSKCLSYWNARLVTFYGGQFNRNDRFVLVNYGLDEAQMWMLDRGEYDPKAKDGQANNRVVPLGDYAKAISDFRGCFQYLEGRLQDPHYAGVWDAMANGLDAMSRVEQSWWMRKSVQNGRPDHWRTQLVSHCKWRDVGRPDCESSSPADKESTPWRDVAGLHAMEETSRGVWERMRDGLKKGVDGISAVQPPSSRKNPQGGQGGAAARARPITLKWEERIAAAAQKSAAQGGRSGTRGQDLLMESDDELLEETKNFEPGSSPSCPQAKRVQASEIDYMPFEDGMLVKGFHGQTVFYCHSRDEVLKPLQAGNVLDILGDTRTKGSLVSGALRWFQDAKVQCRVPYGAWGSEEERDKYRGMRLVLFGRDSFGMYEMIDEAALRALEREMCAVLKNKRDKRTKESLGWYVGYDHGGTCIRHDVNTAWQRGQVERALEGSFLGGVEDIVARVAVAASGAGDDRTREWVSELVQEAIRVSMPPVCVCARMRAVRRHVMGAATAGERREGRGGGPGRPGQAGRDVGLRAVAGVRPGGRLGPGRAGQGLGPAAGGQGGGRGDTEDRAASAGEQEAARRGGVPGQGRRGRVRGGEPEQEGHPGPWLRDHNQDVGG